MHTLVVDRSTTRFRWLLVGFGWLLVGWLFLSIDRHPSIGVVGSVVAVVVTVVGCGGCRHLLCPAMQHHLVVDGPGGCRRRRQATKLVVVLLPDHCSSVRSFGISFRLRSPTNQPPQQQLLWMNEFIVPPFFVCVVLLCLLFLLFV